MAVRTIETRAVLSAEDKTGPAFAAVVQHMAKMEEAARRAQAGVKIATAAEGHAAQQRGASRVDERRLRQQVQIDRREEAAARREQVSHAREMSRYQHEVSHHGVGRYVAQGAATAVAAHSIVDVIKDSLKAGAGYQHEVTALQNAGRNAAEMEQITKAARDAVQQIPTSTYTENMRVINETTSAFGSLNHAIENLTFMQKGASVLQAASPAGAHVDAAELGNKMARFFEERGTAGNPELFRKEASALVQAMAFSGGKFNPAEALNFAQQAKSSLQNYDLRFLTRIAPSLIATQGGQRAGTSANAFTSVIMGKANDAKQAAEWQKYGLLDATQTINKSGKVVAWRAGAVKDTDLALRDPLEWAEKVALPAMMAKGVKVDDRLELAKVLGTMFRNQNSNVFANEIMQLAQRLRLHKDEAMQNQVGTLDEQYARNLGQDPTIAVTALKAALEDLITAVSAPVMGSAAAGLTTFANGIQAVANALKDHPILAVTTGTALAGGALAGSGYMAYQIANGFGLGASATALEGSAMALDVAAARLGAAGTLSSAEHAAERYIGGAAAAEGAGSTALRMGGKAAGLLGLGAGGTAALLATSALVFEYGTAYALGKYKDAHPDQFYAHAGGREGYYRTHPEDRPDAIPAAGHYEGGTYGRGGWHGRQWTFDKQFDRQTTPYEGKDDNLGRAFPASRDVIGAA